MKRNLLTMLLVGLCSLTASASFDYRGIFYNITSSTDLRVEVTSGGSSGKYSGKVIIPATVSYNGKTYSVTSIGGEAFKYCSSLTSITIPSSVTSIEFQAFLGCSSLTSTSITIPENVTSIGSSAFYGCSGLTTITIPENVTSIGSGAFEGCSSLTSITCRAIEPPVAGHDAFNGIKPNIPVYVPAESIEVYKSLNDWGYFTNYFALEPEPDSEHTITYRVDGEIFKSESLLPGTPITLPEAPTKEGYVFSGWRWSQKVFNFVKNANTILYTNAKCTNTSYGDQFVGWHVLFDGNANTFFHSEYSNVDSEDGLDHYLRVDMGNSAKEFSFTYTTRGNIPTNGNYSPKTMVVEGSNTTDGEYTEIATLTNLPNSAAAVYESGILSNGNAYRYIRFRVTETFQNAKVQEHPYFFMAEFGMTKYHEGQEASNIPSTMPAEDIVISGSFVKNGITSLDQLNNETLYSISLPYHTKCPASWAVAEGGTEMKSNADLMLPFDANDTKQQFAFISNDGGATRFLYHTAEKKFVGKKGVLTAEPMDAILFMDGAYENTFFAYFDNDNYINVGGSQEMTINTWSTADGGNSAFISPIANFDPTEALKAFPRVEVTGITLSHTAVTLTKGDSFTLTATITPNNATDKTVTWSSSNPNVATIDAMGVITAVAAGTSTITASIHGMTASCELTVNRLDILGTCEAPTISYVGGQVQLDCATPDVQYVANMKSDNLHTIDFEDKALDFVPSYTITAYATKENYEDSETTTVTLCWIACEENHEGEDGPNTKIEIPSRPVLIQSRDGVITLTGLAEGTQVTVFTTNSTQVASATATGGTTTIATDLETGTIVIIKMGESSVKVVIK